MIIDIERLPMVALRGLVVFPYTVVNFEVAREISIEALTRAMNGDQRLFLVTQKDMRVEMPTEDDVYQVGVIGFRATRCVCFWRVFAVRKYAPASWKSALWRT